MKANVVARVNQVYQAGVPTVIGWIVSAGETSAPFSTRGVVRAMLDLFVQREHG